MRSKNIEDSERLTESAFIQGIRASPSDRLARLVYADWLDERGDGRGEFLRLQCQVIVSLVRLAELSADLPLRWTSQVDLFSHTISVFRVPPLGESVEHCTVVAHLTKPGVRLSFGEDLMEVETDKAQFTLSAPHASVVLAWLVPVGRTVLIDAPLALLLRV